MDRQPSYGELASLQVELNKQLEFVGITICDEDYWTEIFNDFVDQYRMGQDQPVANLLYPDRMIQNGSVVKFKDIYPGMTFKVVGFVRPGEELSPWSGDGETNDSDELIYRMVLDESSKVWMGFEYMYGQASDLEVA